MPTGLVDSHAHLLRRYYEQDLEAVLARAREAGCAWLVNVGTNVEDSREAIELAEREPDVVATAGVHPHEASSLDGAALDRLEQLASSPSVVAVGECGLDYHYDLSPREQQREALRQQIRLAHRLGKPLVLHSRESDADLVEILEQERAGELGAVVHCFSSTPEVARRLLGLGLHLGFGGMLTFRAADTIRAALEQCPDERLLIETDCPYLAPVPHRGKRNEPAFVALVAERAAELRGCSPEHLARVSAENAARLFRRL